MVRTFDESFDNTIAVEKSQDVCDKLRLRGESSNCLAVRKSTGGIEKHRGT
jgi:hypothetical protein